MKDPVKAYEALVRKAAAIDKAFWAGYEKRHAKAKSKTNPPQPRDNRGRWINS